MFNSSSCQPGFLHRCSLPSIQRKWISGGAEKVFLEILVSLDAPVPLIPERLCSAQRNKGTARIYRCILREVLPLLHSQSHLLCSSNHLWKAAWIQVLDITIPRVWASRGGLGKAPGRGVGSVLGLPAPRIVPSIPGKGRAQAPKAQCRFSRHLCLAPRAPPLRSPLMLTVCIIIYCYQGIWFDQ